MQTCEREISTEENRITGQIISSAIKIHSHIGPGVLRANVRDAGGVPFEFVTIAVSDGKDIDFPGTGVMVAPGLQTEGKSLQRAQGVGMGNH